ncbi:UNVERIFIED_CONTAM: hypothetical protein Slati_0122700 [Sesamum latifolium]|uniref:Endonuclease/exonuclease/phosphatase domain-containing protein n=1 Tax=Sesamum latifolium TaxID=2727402 RepID=A0AAW2Y9M8_9LAMI
MRGLFWNVRGIRNDPTQRVLNRVRKQNHLDFLAIMEPMVPLDGQFMARRLGFQEVGLDVRCKVLLDHEQLLHLRLESNRWPKSIFLTAVYARCDIVERQDLWDALRAVSVGASPWIVGGDFNTVLSLEKRSGGAAPSSVAMSDFHDVIADCALVDAGYTGSPYTVVTHLELSKSDHYGLLVEAETTMEWKASSFRFQHLWAKQPGFLEVVRRNWLYPPLERYGSASAEINSTKALSEGLEQECLWNVVDRVVAAERNLKEADEAYDLDPCDRTLVERNRCSAELVRALAQEEAF